MNYVKAMGRSKTTTLAFLSVTAGNQLLTQLWTIIKVKQVDMKIQTPDEDQ